MKNLTLPKQENARRVPIARVVGVLLLLTLLGLGCRGSGKVVESLPKVNLQLWTVWDEPDDYAEIIRAYQQQHPNVRITVKKTAYDTFGETLIQSWARDEGPDIFSVPNNAVGTYREFIAPMPASTQLPTLVVRGGCSKDVRVVQTQKATTPPERLDDTFIPVVADDVVFANQIYGLPLAADTLALFYNKDLLNEAKIIAPPRTWQEFVDQVDSSKATLTKEVNGEIVQAGAALGTAKNINRAADILSLLMMQSGAQMVDPSGRSVTFQNSSPADKNVHPGIAALQFYTAFASPSRVAYTWNDQQPEAQEAFAAGKVAYFIGYSYQVPLLRQQNPQLNFGIASLPQISLSGPEVNYANYWVATVAKKSAHQNEAWDFLLFATAEQQATTYLAKTDRPTALKKLIPNQQADLDLEAFANALLVAKSWYHGYDYRAAEESFATLIDEVHAGKGADEALGLAAQKVQKTLQQP